MVIIIFYKIKLPNAQARRKVMVKSKKRSFFSAWWNMKDSHAKALNKQISFGSRFFRANTSRKIMNQMNSKWVLSPKRAESGTHACLLACLFAHSLAHPPHSFSHTLDFIRAKIWRVSEERHATLKCMHIFASIWELQIVQRVVVALCVCVFLCFRLSHFVFSVCLTFFTSYIRFRLHLNQLKAFEKKNGAKTWKIIIFH